MSGVVSVLLGDGVWELGRGVPVAVENVSEGAAGFLTRNTSPDDLSNE